MPTPRGSTRHVERIERHGDAVSRLLRSIEAVAADGRVDPAEWACLRRAMAAVRQSYAPLPGEAMALDGALRVIGAVAGAGHVSAYVLRVAREVQEDTELVCGAWNEEPTAA